MKCKASVVSIFTQRSLCDRCSYWGSSRNHFFWKIAGLRPAIFSGTPGNFDFKFLKGVIILDRLVEQTPIEWENVSPHLTPEGNCILVRTKLVLGELFPFLDLQDCLASLRSADNCPVDLGKWKVLPRQVLFLLESIPSGVRREEYIFLL